MSQIIKQPVDLLFNKAVLGPDMTEDEKQIINTLFAHTEDEVTAYIPDDIDSADLTPMMIASVKAYSRMDKAQKKLKPILGRMFCVISKRPDLISELGCKDFTDFIKGYVPKQFHLPASEAWAAYSQAREYGDQLTVSVFETVGYGKLKAIAKATPKPDGPDSEVPSDVRRKREELIEAAKGMTLGQLADHIQSLGIMEKETLMPTKISFHSDAATAREWKEFVSHPAIQAYTGTRDHNKIFQFMMAECSAAWMTAVANEGA